MIQLSIPSIFQSTLNIWWKFWSLAFPEQLHNQPYSKLCRCVFYAASFPCIFFFIWENLNFTPCFLCGFSSPSCPVPSLWLVTLFVAAEPYLICFPVWELRVNVALSDTRPVPRVSSAAFIKIYIKDASLVFSVVLQQRKKVLSLFLTINKHAANPSSLLI